MLFRERTPRGIAGALIGLVEGTLLGCGVLAVWYVLGDSFPSWLDVRYRVGLAVFGGLVLALGRGISGSLAGAGVGCVVGIFLGLPMALLLPADWDVSLARDGSGPRNSFAVAGPSLDGKMIDTADYRGKVVLVDFWATWCPPCVQEMPQVKAAYERYHQQGLEIVGVSLDYSRDDLETFVRKNDIPWPQIYFPDPAVQRNNPLANQYNVLGIPTLFLLDRDGNLISRDLRGHELIDEIGRQVDPQANGPPRHGPDSRQTIPVRLFLAAGTMLLVGAFVGAVLQRRLIRRGAISSGQKLSVS